ncbi:unnamed protein product, partial [Meganyctiphanes norvegica]
MVILIITKDLIYQKFQNPFNLFNLYTALTCPAKIFLISDFFSMFRMDRRCPAVYKIYRDHFFLTKTVFDNQSTADLIILCELENYVIMTYGRDFLKLGLHTCICLNSLKMDNSNMNYSWNICIPTKSKPILRVLFTVEYIAVDMSWSSKAIIKNLLGKIIMNRRYAVSDKQIQGYMQMTLEDFDIIQGPIALLDIMPWLIPLLPRIIKNKWMKVNSLENSREKLNKLFMPVIKHHLATLDPANPRDYIDMYLLEVEAQKDNPDSFFKPDYSDLLASLDDLFAAGSETTSTTLRWFIMFMVLHQDVQCKIQEELDRVVPRSRSPCLEDRESLQYLEAVIHEVHRKASILKLGLAHSVTEDTFIGTYDIPKCH